MCTFIVIPVALVSIHHRFRGIDAQTVWTTKERDVVYFDTYSDAVRIKGDMDSDEAKQALEQMRKNAEENYTEANIRKASEP